MTRIAVLGASGFVGSALVHAAEQAGHDVLLLRAPRLGESSDHDEVVASLATLMEGSDVVVNCAGNPDASAASLENLRWANAVLPGVIGAAASRSNTPRYIHVSSAVVQGRRAVLDSSGETDGFSPYARSKIVGETAARTHGPLVTTIYRPPSVHAPSRRVTQQLARIARSPLASVAAPGDRHSPQTHIRDVGDALLLLCTSDTSPPPVVHHPWQGHTTAKLLEMLSGGRTPKRISTIQTRVILVAAQGMGRLVPRVAPYARRLEMVWMGQDQAPSWFDEQGWKPVTSDVDWMMLGSEAIDARKLSSTKGKQ